MWSTASFFARMSLTSTNLVNRSTINEKPVYPFGDGGNLVTSSQWMEWHGCSALFNFSPGIGFAFILFNRQDAQEKGIVNIEFVLGESNIADIMTKSVRSVTAYRLHRDHMCHRLQGSVKECGCKI